MLRTWPNLVVLGVVAVLLCSTPVFKGRAPSASAMSSAHDHMHHHAPASGAMTMVFDYGYTTTIWFSVLKTDTLASYLAVLLGLGLLAFVHEGLTAFRRARGIGLFGPGEEVEAARGALDPKLLLAAGGVGGRGERLIAAGLHTLSLTLSYLLMLAVMSMNMGVFVAVLLGFGAGFYAFNSGGGGGGGGTERGTVPPVIRGDACHSS